MPGDLTITRLSTTPVKGLLLDHPDSIELTAEGAVGDRAFYLLDDRGKIQSCTRNPGLYGLSATYDADSRRLRVRRGDEVLLDRVVEPARALDVDMWGLRSAPVRRGRGPDVEQLLLRPHRPARHPAAGAGTRRTTYDR